MPFSPREQRWRPISLQPSLHVYCWLVAALAFRPAPAAAQGPSPSGGAANNLQQVIEALSARVTALEAAVSAEATTRAEANTAIDGLRRQAGVLSDRGAGPGAAAEWRRPQRVHGVDSDAEPSLIPPIDGLTFPLHTSHFQAGSRTIVASRCWSAADGSAVRPVCTGEI